MIKTTLAESAEILMWQTSTCFSRTCGVLKTVIALYKNHRMKLQQNSCYENNHDD